MTHERSMNFSLVYSSKQYEESDYIMTVRVYTEITFFREEIATSSIKFRITKQLNGEIVIHQNASKGRIVSSKENVQFKVDLHDPSGLSAISYKSVQLRAGATRKVLMRKVLMRKVLKVLLTFGLSYPNPN